MGDESLISYQVKIGDQAFRVRIHPNERKFYDSVSKYVEQAYEEIAKQAVTGGPKAWAMACFQLGCELFEVRESQRAAADPEKSERLKRIIQRIEDVTTGT